MSEHLTTRELLEKILHRVERPHESHWYQPTWSKVLGLITILGLATFWPRFTVTQSDPVDPNNPFSAAFVLTNTGWTSMHDVRIAYAIAHMTFSGDYPETIGDPHYNSRMFLNNWEEHVVGIDQRATITISDLYYGQHLESCDMAIVVVYQPWIISHDMEKVFRFVAKRQSNRQLYWYAEPIP